jgi:TatD DNase family protein
MFVDSHCHLSFPELPIASTNPGADMAAIGSTGRCASAPRWRSSIASMRWLRRYDNFWCSVGVHPDNEGVREPDIEDLVRWRSGRGSWPSERRGSTTTASMVAAWRHGMAARPLRVHIRAARATGLPLVVHTRSASADTLASCARRGRAVGGVFHCFTETMQVAARRWILAFTSRFPAS